jgi:hypothetical protein
MPKWRGMLSRAKVFLCAGKPAINHGLQKMTEEESGMVERAIRRALVKDAQRWERLVREANEICRSAHELVSRRGADTNWESFERQLDVVLKNQQAALNPKPEPSND